MKRTEVLLVGMYGIENSGVRHLASMLRDRGGYKADILFFRDWRNNQVPWPTIHEYDLLVEHVREHGYHLVGLSFGSPYWRIAIEVTRRLKAALGEAVTVLWGGLHTTLVPEDCIDHADALIVGEGELPLLELVDRMEAREPWHDVRSVWTRDAAGEVIKNPVRPLMKDLDQLPFRVLGGEGIWLIDGDRKTEGDPLVKHHEFRIFASRGCPFSCAYCYNSSLKAIYPDGGNLHRRRSVQSVIEELRQARRIIPKIRWVKFDDDTFVFPKRWLKEFCEAYAAEFPDLPFDCMITPETARRDNLEMLKAAGLRGVQLGIEAGSDREQKEVYERTSTVEQVLAFDRMNVDLGLDVKYDVIIDNPLSIRSDKEALFHLLMDMHGPYKIYLYSLTLFPKSGVTQKMIDAGLATPWDVEGYATKSFRQFRVSIDWPRSAEETFYLALLMLVNKQFIPKKLLWHFHGSEFWRKHPHLLLEMAGAANLIRMTRIAAEMLLRGELSWQKVREYSNIRKMINQ
jgi:anaerobic magnesium-protoporphyrin IX monomethyl ester cyclase